MKIDISSWALDNKNVVRFFVCCLLVGGIFAYLDMPKLEDPAIKVKQAMVITTYPGASAHEVELEVTDRLEKSIREMQSVDNVTSQSMADLSLITVELKTTTKDADVEQQYDMLRRKVNNAAVSLPATASTPIVRDDFGDVYGIFYALTGDGLSDRDLSDYAENVKRNVADIEGVSRVDIYGKREECIYIEFHQDKMANLGVMPAEVIQTLNAQNKTAYAGYFDNGNRRVRVNVADKFKNVDDISRMLIQGHDGEQIRISDVARVYKGYVEPTRNELMRDGERALGISIACLPDHDILKVGAKVEKTIEQLTKTMPVGVKCEKIFFQPERVSDALDTFLINLLESVVIVVLVLIFTMGLKSGLIIGASLITIVMGSLLILQGFDGTLQRVSLAAFVLAMGMLVDNAIVIMDGILVSQKRGASRRSMLTSIGRRTAMPLLGATLIAILAFWPIFVSPDTAGVYVHDLFIVIAVSLLLSWVLALTHVPIMADSLLKKPKGKRKGASPTSTCTHRKTTTASVATTTASATAKDASITTTEAPVGTTEAPIGTTEVRVETHEETPELYRGFSYRVLETCLRFSLKHYILTLLSAAGLLVLCAIGYGFLNQAFFPDMEYDQLYMEYKLPEGYNSTQVEADLEEAAAYLKTRKEITHITTSIGGTPSRYNLVRSFATPSLSYGELIIDFTSPKDLVDNIDDIQAALTKRFPDAYIKLKRYNLMFKKYPIEVCFSGPDPAVLRRLADSTLHAINQSEYVYLATTDWEPLVPTLSVDYDQPSARTSGLSRSDVALSIMAYTGGIPVATFYDGIHTENIYFKCTDQNGRPIDRIENVPVFGTIPNFTSVLNSDMVRGLMSGSIKKEDVLERLTQTAPLKQVAKGVDIVWEEPVVMRYNGQRMLRVQCSPRPGVGTEKARQSVAAIVEQFHLPQGYTLTWQGEKKASDQSMKYLFRGFPTAILMMFAILLLLFKDFKKPAIIFCCIPLVVTGVIPAVLLTGKAFGFVAIVGVLGLIGMMIKNGIVLMDEIDLNISQGMQPYKALIESSKSRLRPVMMASLTTILGMIPLIPDAMFGSLAVTIMGGLFMGTLITLIFIPMLYSLFFHIRHPKNA
jgi:multidrug efflux pump subunit AcrB